MKRKLENVETLREKYLENGINGFSNSKSITNNYGITLIALVVTIVVLLILSGITLAVLTGKNGIIQSAKDSKNIHEIAEDIDNIKLVVLSHKLESDEGYTEKTLVESLKEQKWCEDAIDNGDKSVDVTTNKGRHYEVKEDGTVNVITKCEDATPGELSGTGTESDPFKIESIEDLVLFSMMSDENNKKLGIKFNNFNGQYVTLERTLNFESDLSYKDATSIKYGDLNKDGKVEDIKTELTKKEEGCIGFTKILTFGGIFDGKGNTIQNIYMFNDDDDQVLALFSAGREIKNLNISGTIINNKWHAGGISAYASKISNCINYASITGYNMVGGIAAYGAGAEIKNCKNYGNITKTGQRWSYGGAGGIVGFINGTGEIKECINYGNIESDGGIVGYAEDNISIINCINYGKANSGIVYDERRGNFKIINCYNLGEVNDGLISSFTGRSGDDIQTLTINNSYNLGKVTNAGIIGVQGATCEKTTLNIENCYNAGESKYAIVGRIDKGTQTTTTTNITNTYYQKSKVENIGATSDGILAKAIKNNSSFVEILNENIGSNTEWKQWTICDKLNN